MSQMFGTTYVLELNGVATRAASVGDPNEGTGTVLLEVEVPREGDRPWKWGSDRWLVQVPAGQLAEAQALYPPGGECESGELGKALKAVQYRRVTVEFGPSYLTQSRHVWLRRLFRRAIELGDVKWVQFGDLYEDS